jgi:peptidoglycan/LPS O-acetylase OafA/YrhL
VAYHLLSWRFRWLIESAEALLVYVFFVLSDLTMMMVYDQRIGSGMTSSLLSAFLRARVARLLPVLIFSALGAYLAMALFLKPSVLARRSRPS